MNVWIHPDMLVKSATPERIRELREAFEKGAPMDLSIEELRTVVQINQENSSIDLYRRYQRCVR